MLFNKYCCAIQNIIGCAYQGYPKRMSRVTSFQRAILFCLAMSFCTQGWAQQPNGSFELSKAQKLIGKLGSNTSDSDYVVSGEILRYNSNFSVIHDALMYGPEFSKMATQYGCTFFVRRFINIQSNNFFDSGVSVPSPCGNDLVEPELFLIKGVSFLNNAIHGDVKIKRLNITSRASLFSYQGNISNAVSIDENNFGLAVIQRDTFSSFSLSYSKLKLAVIGLNELKNRDGNIDVTYSSFTTGLEIIDNNCSRILLQNDSLEGLLQVHLVEKEGVATSNVNRLQLTFQKCYINANVIISVDTIHKTSKVVFENCAFGSAASLFNLKVDTVVFLNCSSIPAPLFMTADSTKRTIALQIVNSAVDNLIFDYASSFKLFFDPKTSPEDINSLYQSLIGKYKKEGKPENLENITIQYKAYEYSKHWWQYPVWFLDVIWWYYGYKKILIVFWAIGLLLIFYSLNYYYWDEIRKVYEMFSADDIEQLTTGTRKERRRRKQAMVLALTAYIFFSWRVEFDKLKYSKLSMLILFFAEYLVGLMCLFFLANAIFKL